MALKPLLQQLLIWATISTASSYQTHLISEVSKLIPSCAQDCLKTFIEVNFLSTACGAYPTLQCLCSHQTQTGFTTGEGAVQCIVAERQLGNCQTDEAGPSAISTAYQMCSGQVSALPNTHPTLSATLVLPSSGAGVVIIQTPTTSPLSTVPSLTATTSTARQTTYVTNPGTSTTTRTLNTTSRTSIISPTETTNATAIPSPQTSEEQGPSTTLATGQIVGISVGVVGAIALALGAIFLARRARKHNYPDFSDDGLGFFPMDEKRSPSSETAVGRAAKRFTNIFHISPPILRSQRRPSSIEFLHPRQITPPLPSGSTINRNTIGLAISRPRSEMTPIQPPEAVHRRPTSKFLPPRPVRPVKPALTLNIPSSRALRPGSSQPPQTDRTVTDRTSTMTNVTAFADLDTEAAEGGQIWRPPPSDPQSATTYYVADKWGNWVLSNNTRKSELTQVTEAAELDTYTPLTKSPIEKKEEKKREAASQMAAAISAAAMVPDISRPQPAFLARDPADQSDSRASSFYSQASAPRPGIRPLVVPSAAASRSNSSGPRRIGRSDSSKHSHDSVTTIITSSSSPFDDDEDIEPESGHLSALSPVIESPRTPNGHSPVKYPKIPGRIDGATLRLVPPPKRPNFTASPPGQPSPTLGAAFLVQSSPSAYPEPLNPRRYSSMDRSNMQASGSGFSPTTSHVPTFPIPPLNPSPRIYTQSERELTDNFPIQIDMRQPSRPHIASFTSPTSAATRSSNASSLLAKRLGSERAAALSLEKNQANGGRGQTWRRQDNGGLLSPDVSRQTPRMRLPATPTWQPKLTPTRRGEDLFLNVQ